MSLDPKNPIPFTIAFADPDLPLIVGTGAQGGRQTADNNVGNPRQVTEIDRSLHPIPDRSVANILDFRIHLYFLFRH